MEVIGDLWINICGRKAPTGYTSEDWDNLVSFVKEGIKYVNEYLLSDADFDPGEVVLSDMYHFVNNGKLLLEEIKEVSNE